MAISRGLVAVYSEYLNQWVELPQPSDYSGISTTLVDSGRNASGIVIADVIKSDVAKIELKWNFLTPSQYSTIAQLFEPKYNGDDMNAFFKPVSFFDVIANAFEGSLSSPPNPTNNKCRIFYCGDRKVQFAKMIVNDNGTPQGYANVSLNLIDTGRIYGE